MDDVEFMESEDAAGARFIDLLTRGRSLAAEVRRLWAQYEQRTAEWKRLHRDRDAREAEVWRLRAEREQMGTLPFEAAFLVYGEPEQLIFRGPTGQVVLRRVRDTPLGTGEA